MSTPSTVAALAIRNGQYYPMRDEGGADDVSERRPRGNGVRFPMHVQQSIGGFPVLDLVIKDVQVNPAISLPVPEAARNQGENVTADAVAPGVWFIGGGSHFAQ